MKSKFSFHDLLGTVYYMPFCEEVSFNHIPYTAVSFLKEGYEITEAGYPTYYNDEGCCVKLCLEKKERVISVGYNTFKFVYNSSSPSLLRLEMRKKNLLEIYK